LIRSTDLRIATFSFFSISSSIDGIESVEVECTYSLAKRRGPTPGRVGHDNGNVNSVNANGSDINGSAINNGTTNPMGISSQQFNLQGLPPTMNGNPDWQRLTHQSQPSIPISNNNMMTVGPGENDSRLTQQQQQQLAAFMMGASGGTCGIVEQGTNNQGNLQHHLNLLQHQIQQRQQQLQLAQQQQQFQMQTNLANAGTLTNEPTAQRRRVDVVEKPAKPDIPQTILSHTHMLDRDDPDGSRLRAYYKLSIDELFRLPGTPSDDEYCATTGQPIAGRHLAALSAVRFAETAIGAIVNNEVILGTELCNAAVHCLREAVHDVVETSILFEVAKAYFLLGVFRSIRGDMVRYFKYRRVALTYLSRSKVRFSAGC
jgi:hypothetical protein